MHTYLNIFSPSIARNIKYCWELPAYEGLFADFPSELPDDVITILRKLNVNQLFFHQAECIETIFAGHNTIISTGTASGKSLCYQIPILTSHLTDHKSTSLLLYPTKALSNDQGKSFIEISEVLEQQKKEKFRIGIYDGDTPTGVRKAIRNNSDVLITNPDMLHLGILPHHPTWERFISRLKYVVIDEAHVYSGIFGSHFINLIRRLKRITSYYGSSPQYILSSATIAKPKIFAQKLLEDEVVAFEKDNSPRGKRNFYFYNPPLINQSLGIRKSTTDAAITISNHLLSNGYQTILFAKSRIAVEMIYKKIKNLNQDIQAIAPYRSGYTKEERKEIEDGLKNNELDLVISTIALELGIDMGMVDAILMHGYPGSITRFLQQAGRAGRNNKESFCIMVASSAPVDQYIIQHPEFVELNTPEEIFFNPDNPYILFSHIKNAAFELPIQNSEGFGSLAFNKLKPFIDILRKTRIIYSDGEKHFWTSEQYPASEISLRSIGGTPIQLFFHKNDTLMRLGEIDVQSAKKFVHPGAVYLHKGEPFIVENLDASTALMHSAVDIPFFTKPILEIKSIIENIRETSENAKAIKGFGEVTVTEHVTGYKRIKWESNNELGREKLDLSPDILETRGFWIQFTENITSIMQNTLLFAIKPINYGSQWVKFRNKILNRDNFTCQSCGIPLNKSTLHIHHKIPVRTFSAVSKAHHPENLIALCPRCHKMAEMNQRIRSTLSGLGFGLKYLIPAFVRCSPGDIGFTSDKKIKSSKDLPGIMVYDQFPGGIGLSHAAFKMIDRILIALKEQIDSCPCEDGCPSCVGPGGENGLGAKKSVEKLLGLMLN